MGKSQGSLFCALPFRFCEAENALCRSLSTVCQSSHFTTVLQTSEFMQESSFLSMMTKSHFSYAFSNIWKHLLFTGDCFAGVLSIYSVMLFLAHGTFLHMAPWFQRSIQLAASWMQCSLQETLEKLLLLSVFYTHAKHFREQICIFLSFTHVQHVQKWLR